MGIVVRQSIKSVIITLIGILLGGVITLLSSRYFPKSEYGFTLNLINVVTHISLLSLLGFTSTLLIIGQRYPIGHKARGTFLSICVFFPMLFSLLISALFLILKEQFLGLYHGEDRLRMQEYFILFPLFTLISIAISWLEGYLQSLNKTAVQTFAREVLVRVIYITLIVLYAFGVIGYKQFIWLFVLLYLIPFLYLFFIARSGGGFVFEYIRGLFPIKEIKEILRFSGYNMLTVISSILITQTSVLLLGPLSPDGLESVAVYFVASFVISVLRNPMRVMGVATIPTFAKVYHEGRLEDMRALFLRSSVNMQLFGVASFALVYLNINAIQDVMSIIQEGYSEIKGIIMILMIGQLIDMLAGFNSELIGVTKFYRYNFWIALFILCLVFVLNYFLILKYSVFGAAWATAIGLAMFNVIKSTFLWRKFRIPPFNKTSFVIVMMGLAAALAAWVIPTLSNVFIDLIVRTSVFGAIFVFLAWKLKISLELNRLLVNVVRHKRFY